MKKLDTSFITAAAGMLCAAAFCALAASGETAFPDAAVTAAAMAVFYGLYRLAKRFCPALDWLGQALFCGVGFYVAAQLLSLGEFSWQSTADGPLHELGAAWIALVFAVLYAIGRARFAVIGTALVVTVFGVANYALTQFRGRPFLLIDLSSIGTALNVSGSYELEFEPVFILGLIYTAALTVFAWRLFPGGAKVGIASQVLRRALPLAGAAVFVYCCFYGGLMYRNGIYMNWNDNEFRSSSVMYFFATASTLDIEEPEGYSEETLDGIVLHLMENADEHAYYASTGDGEDPDIIVVMSESFSDTRELGELETDNAFFSYFDELENETIHGHVYSSVIGGNTANSEYELLTGDSCAFLPTGAVAYQTYINYPVGTLVSTLKDQGYSASMLHPHWSTGWNRIQVYGLFGFDRTLWRESYRAVDTLRGYTTDEWDYEKLIELYEEERAAQADDEGVFIFNITMQNHGGYGYNSFRETVHISGHEGEFPLTEQYLSLIRLTDEDTRALIDYFRNVDREVIILFFGDHQPNLEKEFYDLVYGHDTTSLPLSEFQRKYITPFYIWSNKGLEARDEGYTSINYLSQLLLEEAGLENTPYGYFLSDLQEEWPVINANGAMDADGEWHYLTDEEFTGDEDIATYRILQYNRLFDPSGYREELYTIR